ncbi:MAG: Stress responsive Barrel Domain protein [Ilumatobacteraceae bacterium]|nr:Stress responsive Barrel Domain protein [Ilumatobacteraceae bacterium]
MTLRHVVCFRFLPGTTPEQITALADGLRELPGIIPEIVAYHVGPNLGINPGTWDFAVTADFDDEAGFVAYRDHREHQARIQSFVTPIQAERVAVQFAT